MSKGPRQGEDTEDRRHLMRQMPQQASAEDGQDTKDVIPSGEFDEDEDEETIAMVRASKNTRPQGPGPTVVCPSPAPNASAGSRGYIPLGRRTQDVCAQLTFILQLG